MSDTKTDIHQIAPNDEKQKKLLRWKKKWRGRYVRALVSQYESYLDQSADMSLDATGDGGRAILDRMSQLEFQIESAIHQEIMMRVALGLGAFGLLLSAFTFQRAMKLRSAVFLIGERVRKIETSVQGMQNNGKSATDKVDDIEKEITDTGAKITATDGKVAALESRLAAAEAKVQELSTRAEAKGSTKKKKRK